MQSVGGFGFTCLRPPVLELRLLQGSRAPAPTGVSWRLGTSFCSHSTPSQALLRRHHLVAQPLTETALPATLRCAAAIAFTLRGTTSKVLLYSSAVRPA